MTDHAYVAYLDILGYKDLLSADLQAGTQTFKDRMTRSFRTFEDINTSIYHYKAISDSIFITCTERSAAREFLCVVRDVYISFLAEGLMIRGGISYGQHFENQSITYSPVLTKAHFLESTVAQFPRVMVDINIDEMFPDLKKEGLILRSGQYWFLNIVTKNTFEDVWNATLVAFNSNKPAIQASERVRMKYRWLQDFLIEISSKFDIPSPKPYLGIFDEEPPPPVNIIEVPASIDVKTDDLIFGMGRMKAASHRIIDLLLENGPSRVSFLAKTLDLSPMSTVFSLRQLESKGKVRRFKDGDLVLWSLADNDPK